MAKKVLRDIEKKGPEIISLKEESQEKIVIDKSEALDCTSRTKPYRGGVRTESRFASANTLSKFSKSLDNIHPPKSINDNEKEKQILFFHVDANEKDSIGDAIRLGAAGLLIVFVLNIINVYNKGIDLRNSVVTSATSGYHELLQAGDEATNLDFGAAEMTFNQATKNFQEAEQTIAYLRTNEDLFFVKEKTITSVQNLLTSAENISKAGRNFARGIKNLQHLPSLFIQENSGGVQQDSTKKDLTDLLKEDLAYIETAIDQLQQAESDLAEVSPDILPPTFKERLNFAKSKLTQLNEVLEDTRKKIPAFLELLGDRYPHRYLVLLQNDTESRPTGGFIGSYIIIDINDGILTKMDFHDIYELDGQLQEYIEPPEDIARVSDNWRMRDSNYSPDFAISAAKAAWFLQKENGPSVDTIIAVNQSFIADLLELTGPIQLESLKAPLDKTNYQIVLSYIIESKLSGVENPKKILAELIPAFQNKLLTNASLENILTAFMQGFGNKKLFIFSRSEKVQKVLDEFKVSGRIPLISAEDDYLNIIVTSIGGNKSDRYISQKIKHNTLIQRDGKTTNEVIIKRKHTWNIDDLEETRRILRTFGFKDLPDHIASILGKGENKAFIKVYVPKGSNLISADGIKKEEILSRTDEEIQKNYFMFEIHVKPGEEKVVSISYELPRKLSFMPADTYKFHAINQPGYVTSYLEKKVFLKPGIKSYKQYPPSFTTNDEGGYIEYAGLFDGDIYLSTLVGN